MLLSSWQKTVVLTGFSPSRTCNVSILDLDIKNFGSSRSSGVLETERPRAWSTQFRNWNLMLHANPWHHCFTRRTLAHLSAKFSAWSPLFLRAIKTYFSYKDFPSFNLFLEPAETARVSSCRWLTRQWHCTKQVICDWSTGCRGSKFSSGLCCCSRWLWLLVSGLGSIICPCCVIANELWPFVRSYSWQNWRLKR